MSRLLGMLVLIFLFGSASAPLSAQDLSEDPGLSTDETIFCPSFINFQFISNRGNTYLGRGYRGGNALLGKVFYSFDTQSSTYGWAASGTFYVWGVECAALRMTNFLWLDGSRLEYAERSTLACTGGNCRTEYVVVEISYDNGATWSVYWEGYATVCD
jgi:hypothetical protein